MFIDVFSQKETLFDMTFGWSADWPTYSLLLTCLWLFTIYLPFICLLFMYNIYIYIYWFTVWDLISFVQVWFLKCFKHVRLDFFSSSLPLDLFLYYLKPCWRLYIISWSQSYLIIITLCRFIWFEFLIVCLVPQLVQF